MTVKELKDILIHYQDEDEEYQIVLWDYNHQRELKSIGIRASDKLTKTLSFAIDVPTSDGINIFEKLKEFCKKQQENGICKKDKR